MRLHEQFRDEAAVGLSTVRSIARIKGSEYWPQPGILSNADTNHCGPRTVPEKGKMRGGKFFQSYTPAVPSKGFLIPS